MAEEVSVIAIVVAVLQSSCLLTSDGAQVCRGTAGELQVAVPRLQETVVIDGVLDEPAWAQATVLTGFSQYLPVDQRAAEDSTQVLVWYSPTGIYFGIRAYDRSGAVNATLADRDKIQSDDHVQILIDTFDDQRQALVFGVNPLGVQADGIRNEVEVTRVRGGGDPGDIDLTPDFLYESRGRVIDVGYQVELHIPFKSLRYQSERTQDWGINVLRTVQHSGYTNSWTPARQAAASFLSQSGRLVGLHDLERGAVVDLTPTLTSTLTGAPDELDVGWDYDKPDIEVGGNLRVGLGVSFTLDATVNPDFSQVESDVGQLTSNERFDQFFPEKRPFFLEGIDRFATPNQLIHTRRVQEPVAGAKLTGKVGSLTIGLLSAVDHSSRSSTGSNPVFNLLRLRRDLGSQSTIGVVYTDRVDGRAYNRLAAADLRMVVGDVHTISLQAGGSFTRSGGSTRSAPIWEMGYARTGRRLVMSYRATGIHEDFEAHSGFVPRPGVLSTAASNTLNFHGAPGALIERWSPSFRTLGWWSYGGVRDEAPLESKTFLGTSFVLRGGWNVSLTWGWESYAFDPADYASYGLVRWKGAVSDTIPFQAPSRIRDVQGLLSRLRTPEFGSFSASVGLNFWDDVGFREARPVNLVRINAEVNWRPTDRIRVNLLYNRLDLDRRIDGSRLSTEDIPRLKVEYQLARSVLIRFVGQYVSSRRSSLRDPRTEEPIYLRDGDTGFYVPSEDQEFNTFDMDLLFSYRPSPGTVVFVGYESQMIESNPFSFRGLDRTQDGFFLKLSYLWRR